MKYKKKIKDDIVKILAESGLDKECWSKILGKLVNYTYKVKVESSSSNNMGVTWNGSAEF